MGGYYFTSSSPSDSVIHTVVPKGGYDSERPKPGWDEMGKGTVKSKSGLTSVLMAFYCFQSSHFIWVCEWGVAPLVNLLPPSLLCHCSWRNDDWSLRAHAAESLISFCWGHDRLHPWWWEEPHFPWGNCLLSWQRDVEGDCCLLQCDALYIFSILWLWVPIIMYRLGCVWRGTGRFVCVWESRNWC